MVNTNFGCRLAGDGGNAARANREDFWSSVANSGLDSKLFRRDRSNPLVCHVLDRLTKQRNQSEGTRRTYVGKDLNCKKNLRYQSVSINSLLLARIGFLNAVPLTVKVIACRTRDC